MKILVKKDKVKEFKPITLEVTLESLGELEELCDKLKLSVADILSYIDDTGEDKWK